MSGPKLSQAEIERQQRARMEKRREEYLRRAAGLRRRKEQMRQWYDSETYQKLKQESPAAAGTVRRELEEGIRGLEEGLLRLEEIPVLDQQPLDSYSELLEKAEQKNQELFSRLNQMLRKEEDRLAAVGQRKARRETEETIRRLLQDTGREAPITPEVIGFDFDGETQALRGRLLAFSRELKDGRIPGEKKLQTLADRGSRELEVYAKAPDLADRREQAKLLVEALLNEWQEELRRIRGRRARYDEYCVLAGVLQINPRPAESFSREEDLVKEVRRLKTLYRKKDEMDYIATQINETMVALGYQFVTSSVLRRKNGSEYDYSLYQADEEAGVSIYTDESGAVMMQMTLLGEGPATAGEEELSYQRQLDFCAAHPDIVEALAARSVLLKQINYLPPSKKYTAKKQAVQKGSAKVVDRRRRRRGKQKVRSMQ